MSESDLMTLGIGVASGSVQYLTFQLGDEQYAVPILRVQELKGQSPITPIPNTPPHIRGFMNLRGSVVPVLCLRRRFGLPDIEYGKFAVIILVTVGSKVVGLVADAVSDVVDMAPDDIEPVPEIDGVAAASAVVGMAKTTDGLVLVLDVDRLVGRDTEDPLPSAAPGAGDTVKPGAAAA